MNPAALLQRFRSASLHRRIILLFTVLVLLSQATALIVLSVAGAGIARQQINSDLDSAERIFGRQLDDRHERLLQAAKVLTADFGFREAIGTQDGATLVSALQNGGGRIGAKLMLLAGTDGRLLASVPQAAGDGSQFPFPSLLAAAQSGDGSATSIVFWHGDAYQLVIVPVLAPIPIAWIAMGFRLDAQLAQDLKKLTALDVSFVAHQPGDVWTQLGSSLSDAPRRDLEAWLHGAGLQTPKEERLRLAGEDYQTRLRILTASRDAEIYAVLQRATAPIMAPFERLRSVLIGLVIVSLLLSLGMAWVFAGSIARPLARLTASAGRVREGHYDEPVRAESGEELNLLAESFNHMREGIAAREAHILKLAYEDKLTELPNRLRFKTEVDEAIRQPGESAVKLAVMVLNLNRFRLINAALDFDVGDQVLCHVARRLRNELAAGVMLARLGSDEFGIAAPLAQSDSLGVLLRSIHHCFEHPVVVGGQALDVSAGIGIARFPEDGDEAATLLRCADLACAEARRRGIEHVEFDPVTMSAKRAHLSLLGELRQAIERDELQVYYQPKIALDSGALDGVEALIRWIHPQRGFINPGEFIPFAEQTGYIRLITRWVLATALRDCQAWTQAGLAFGVSVNLSTRDLLDPELGDYVHSQLLHHGVRADSLYLEITESGLMENPAHSLTTLERLDALGVKLSIDDYGTGYSSLAYVKRLPVDELKIDRAFIKDIVHDPRDRAIVRSTIDMAHHLGLQVTAEGVEQPAGVDHLLDMGCDRIQGYVFGKPMPLEQLHQWIRDSGRAVRQRHARMA